MESLDKVLDAQKKEIETNSKVLEEQKKRQNDLSISINQHQLLLEEAKQKKADAALLVKDVDEAIVVAKKEFDLIAKAVVEEKKKHEDIKIKNGDILNKIVNYEQRIKEYEDKIARLMTSYTAQSNAYSIEIATIEQSLQKEIQKGEAKITALKKDITEYQAVKNTANTEALLAVEESKRIKTEIDKLNAELAEGKVLIEQDKNTSLSLKKEITKLSQGIVDLEKETKEHIATIENLKKEIETFAFSREVAKKEIDALVKDKIDFVAQKKAFAQKEEHLRKLYVEAGIVFPE
jgi:chromosome segregation ATPase